MRGLGCPRAAAAAALAWITIAPAPVRPTPHLERPPEDELVLQLVLCGVGPRRLVLREGLLAYRAGERVLLPLGEFAGALDLAIHVDPEAGRAEGWFLTEQRSFWLDAAAGEVRVDGRSERIPADLVEQHLADLYVDAELLARWLPVDLRLELPRLQIEVTAREPLPIQQRLARAHQREGRPSSQDAAPRYARQEVPHGLAEIASLDASQSLEFESDDGVTARYSTLLTGDLLFADGRLHLSGEDGDSLRDVRLTLGRNDPDRRLLGPLRASQFELGDVFTPQLPLISRQREGRGATLSSFPLHGPTDFDRTTLRGDLPPGWEVELYRNGVLLEAQQAGADGRYEFADVPLLFGANRLELELYGPQGQRQSETRRVWVGASMVPAGEQRYRLSFGQQARDLAPASSDPVPDPERRGKPRFFLEYERGLERRLSLAASAASLPLDDAQHSYASFGLRGSLLGAHARLDAATDARGGTALRASAQTELFGIGLSSTHEEFYGFVSERAEPEDALRSRSEARIDGLLASGPLPQIPWSVSGTMERTETGRLDAELRNRLSLALGGLRASHVLDVRRLDGGGLEPYAPIEGTLLLSTRARDLLVRGDLDYELSPAMELASLGLSWERRLWRSWGGQIGVRRELRGSPATLILPRIFGRIRNFGLGLDGWLRDDGEVAVAVALSFGAARDPRTGLLRMRPFGMADEGAASARVFLDLNQNGRFDLGERPLEGVRFDRLSDAETDERGVAFLTGLSSDRPTTLRVERESLEDPFWVPAPEGVEIVARAGKTALVEFPVTPTGEIDGIVHMDRSGVVRPAADVRIELRNQAGSLVREVRTEFDGFYLFDFVPPGRYRVDVAREQIRHASLEEPSGRDVVVEANGSVRSGVDFVIGRSGSQPPTSGVEAPMAQLAPAPAAEPPIARNAARPAAEAPGEYRVQLASYRGPTRAKLGWAQLRADHAPLLAGHAQTIERVSLPDGQVVYRLQLGPLDGEGEARNLCARLREQRVACLVVQPDGSLPLVASP